MREEVDQPDLAAQALDLADGGAHSGLVCAAPGAARATGAVTAAADTQSGRMGRLPPCASDSDEAREVLRERRTFTLAQGDRDAQLLEVLLERLAAELDLALAEERVDVALEL